MRWKFNGKSWIEAEEGEGIYLDGFLKKKLDNIKKIIKKKYDAVILIDGKERTGKSTLGMTMGYYLSDATLSINNFASGMEDASEKIKNLPDESILIVDEGSLVFNSKDTMMSEQKQLMKVLDVVGQKNMIFIVILPSFFDLNKSIAMRRSKFLLHVYTDKALNRGRFSFFGEKRKRTLYEIGKKNFGSYAKPKANFVGAFYGFEPEFYKEYLELKKKSLMEALEGNNKKQLDGFRMIRAVAVRDILLYTLIEKYQVPHKEVLSILNSFNQPLPKSVVSDAVKKIRLKLEQQQIQEPISQQNI